MALSAIRGRSCCFPLEFVIVDDASGDEACARVHEVLEPSQEVVVTSHRLEHWSGIPFARNRGAALANFPIYVITDANTHFPANWDLPIWRHLCPGRVLAATIFDLESSLRGYGCELLLPSMGVRWIGRSGSYGGYVPVSPCTCTVIDRILFHQLGGYDETMPIYGAAEPEFSVRLWLSGYEIVNIPDFYIHHRFRPRNEHELFCTSIREILLRNYLRFASYYLPEDLLSRAYDYYRVRYPSEIDRCLLDLRETNVWSRRSELKRELPLDFRWFMRRFALS